MSNRVSRRQGGRWAAKDQQAEEQQAQNAQQQQPQYAPPPQYAQPQYAPPPAASSTDDMLAQLQKLGELKTAGVLTEEEFQAQKAKILG